VVIVEEKITNVMGEANFRRYARGKLLGKGGFAKCFEFTNLETKKLYASKIIQKSSLQKQRAKQKVIPEIRVA
jgi:polo-like kinase 1